MGFSKTLHIDMDKRSIYNRFIKTNQWNPLPMPVTIKDIANYAGVSPATVSLALQGKACVAEGTGVRIRELARKLGYTPSGLGRALQSGRSGLVGYMIASITHSFYNDVLQGVGSEAARCGYGLLTAITDGSVKESLGQLRIFKEKRIDGLLLSSWSVELAQELLEFERNGSPIVFCSEPSPLEGVPGASTDDLLAGRLAAEAMASAGARRIVFFSPQNELERRYAGCSSRLASLGFGATPFLKGEQALAAALSADPQTRPDAIIAYCDVEAIKAKAVVRGLGLEIPRDVMLLGFDDLPFMAFPDIDLSSVAPQKRRIGEEALRLLLERIQGGRPESCLIAPSVSIRGSMRR